MLRGMQCIALVGSLVAASSAALADKVTLADGQVLTGTVVHQSATEVVLEIAGNQMTFPLSGVKNVEIDAPPPGQALSETVVLPSGTVLHLRLTQALNSRQHGVGTKFTAKLESQLRAGQYVVAPRGTTVYGEIVSAKSSGRAVGKAQLAITFTGMMLNNEIIPISTQGLAAQGTSTAATSAGRTARAAAIGGLIDGSKGAKTGAKVGLGASIVTGGNQINIPAGSLGQTRLHTPLTMQCDSNGCRP